MSVFHTRYDDLDCRTKSAGVSWLSQVNDPSNPNQGFTARDKRSFGMSLQYESNAAPAALRAAPVSQPAAKPEPL